MYSNLQFGKKGEELAARYLAKQNYQLIAKNWRYRYYEIDLICKDENMLVFVEVKTRTSEAIIRPQDAVTRKKQKHLIEGANAYIEMNDLDCESRFDVVSIIQKNDRYKIEHIEDAFTPGEL